jgi:hypothetical protein
VQGANRAWENFHECGMEDSMENKPVHNKTTFVTVRADDPKVKEMLAKRAEKPCPICGVLVKEHSRQQRRECFLKTTGLWEDPSSED